MLPRLCQEISLARGLAAYAVALPSACAAGAGLFRAVAQLRGGNLVARFIARVLIFVGAWLAFGLVMQIIGGPCWLAGPTKFGGYDADPVTGRDIVECSITLGVLFALMGPFVAKARGRDLGF